RIRSTALIEDSTITTAGNNAVGVYANAGNMNANDGADVQLTRVDITTSGTNAHGVHAADGANVAISGGSIETGNAYGLYATGARTSIDATDDLTVRSAGTRAVIAQDQARITMNGGSITSDR